MGLRTKILFVSSVPEDRDYIDVGQESDTISEVLEVIKYNSNFQFVHKHSIIRGKFREILQDYRPDIIHFSGHGGEKEGLVFQDDEEISGEILKSIFDNLHDIKLIYLNSCYSLKQTNVIKDLTNIKNIIGMNKALADYVAIQFSTNFYKNYKRVENIDQAFKDTLNNFKQEYPDILQLPELVKTDQKEEMAVHDLLPYKDPIYRRIYRKRDTKRLIQNQQMSVELLSQIEQSVKIFDEKVINKQIEPEKFWKSDTSVNLSKILIILDSYSEEYGLTSIEVRSLRNSFRTIENIFQILVHKSNSLELQAKESMRENMIKGYENTIKILRKLLFNYKIDSIQKIQPLCPQDSNINILHDTLYKMQSLSVSLNTLKNKILQAVLRNDDVAVQANSISEFSNILYHIEIEYKNFLKIVENEGNPEIGKISMNFKNLLSNLQDQLNLDRVNIVGMYESLDNIYNMQSELYKIFDRCILNLDNNSKQIKSWSEEYESEVRR